MGKHRYGVILDAGSSGSRVYIYRWLNAQAARASGDAQTLASLPEIKTKKKWNKKVHPGISTFALEPERVGPDHLKDLVNFAREHVPEVEAENTPIFLLATAGMRLLPGDQRDALLDNVCAYFRQETKFQLPDCGLHVQVIPGETEGLYGWIAANYLLGGFDEPEKHYHGKGHHTYGFLDMGGASAQIAFAPNATEAERHAEDLKLLRLRRVGGEAVEYRVFVTTWLGFGANEARRRYVEGLLEAYPGSQELPDPCLPVGLKVNQTGHELLPGSPELVGTKPYLVGTGAFPECLRRTYPLLEKERACVDAPCLLNGQHTPAIDFDVNHFVGVSEYWHTTHEVFAMAHKDKAYDFHTYQKQVTDFCSRDWQDIVKDVGSQKWGKKVDEKTVEEVCFKASWLINMLHDGIGVPRVGIEPVKDGSTNKTKAMLGKAADRGFLDPFQAVDKIDGTEVSWTLGKMVLYASSQMPAADQALAVGFGSNIAGVNLPSDFQYAGGKYEPLPTDLDDGHTGGDDWHDRIFNGSYSRRVPGILIFMVILVLAIYLLCGRERRQSAYHKLRRRKAPGFLGSKFFGGSNSPAYEHVLEAANPADDFELDDVEDLRSSSGSSGGGPDPHHTGRSSGWATPVVRGMSPDILRTSPSKGKMYFDSPAGSAGGSAEKGLGITAFERGGSGAMMRTESKERLAPREMVGRRSRAGSPTRRSPMTGSVVKKSLD
ncbi:Golgi apyrase [Friedmanniomyces endolithicus]|nr:Golgi apyrase [Friedmanniomyces endolithicus]KAK0771263.1 Golgi apyrase [Friedmanniomyces endolithicus]KAK0784958.1 Golgi apyrase [Friedmanniomyces endolithicus]KAK0816123.1 Golgi apyrase [Friedmanniomyces endolithicus]KAK0854016.1 Golgi apyrase [Friedmanniomyces endolithicus]